MPAAARARNVKPSIGGKTIALIAGIALACGLAGGIGGAFAVNAFTGQSTPTQMNTQMPDAGGEMTGGAGDENGAGEQGGQSEPPEMPQNGSSDGGQTDGGQSNGNDEGQSGTGQAGESNQSGED